VAQTVLAEMFKGNMMCHNRVKIGMLLRSCVLVRWAGNPQLEVVVSKTAGSRGNAKQSCAMTMTKSMTMTKDQAKPESIIGTCLRPIYFLL
jgi:hypothetical protein